jgi:hypothetical protein
MANLLYYRLLGLLEPFIGRDKAETTIARQLARCKATPDSVTRENVKAIQNYLSGATKIQLAGDKAKQDAFEADLQHFWD